MIDFLNRYTTVDIEKEEKKAKEQLKNGTERAKEWLTTIERECKQILDWNSTIETDSQQETEEKLNHYREEREKANLYYNLLISSYISTMNKAEKLKIDRYISIRKSEFNGIKDIEGDFKEVLESIKTSDLKEWLLNPELNRWKYNTVLSLQEQENKLSYGKEEIKIFLDSVLKPFIKAIDKLGNDKDILKVLKEERAYKEKELANESFFILNYSDKDVIYYRNSKIDMSIQRMIGGEPNMNTKSLIQYRDYENSLIGEITSIDNEIIQRLNVSDFKIYEQIKRKTLYIYDQIKTLKTDKEKKEFFRDRDNFKITLTIDEYANYYGLDISNKTTKDYLRREMTASLMRLKSLTLYLSDRKYKEELGFYEDENIIFGIFGGDIITPSETLRSSTYKMEMNPTFMKVVSSKLSEPKVSVLSAKARKKIKGKNGKNNFTCYTLADILIDNYRILNNHNTKGKGGVKKAPNCDRLKVETILNKLSETGAFINSPTKLNWWRTKIREPLENNLDELVVKKILKQWKYVKNEKGGKTFEERDKVEKDGKLSRDEWYSLTIWYEYNDESGEVKEMLENAKKKRTNRQKAIKRNMEKAKQKSNDQV